RGCEREGRDRRDLSRALSSQPTSTASMPRKNAWWTNVCVRAELVSAECFSLNLLLLNRFSLGEDWPSRGKKQNQNEKANHFCSCPFLNRIPVFGAPAPGH